MFQVHLPLVDPVTAYSLWHGETFIRGKLSHRNFPSMTIFVEPYQSAAIPAGTMLDVRHEYRGVIGQVEYQPGSEVTFQEGE